MSNVGPPPLPDDARGRPRCPRHPEGPGPLEALPDRLLDARLPGLELEEPFSSRRTASATPRSSSAGSPARWTCRRSPSSRGRASRGRRRTSPRSASWSAISGPPQQMHEKDPAKRKEQLDEGRRFIDLAQAMGVKYVRVFGDKIRRRAQEEVMKRVVDGFQQLTGHARARGSHGAHRVARRLHSLGRPRGHPDRVGLHSSPSCGTPATPLWPERRTRRTPYAKLGEVDPPTRTSKT